jgi:Fur family transcriptional regulator, ferric uptake regulator
MRKRLTDFRKELVDLLDRKGLPLNVKEIHECAGDSDLSTVYRALEYLESQGMVRSIFVPCSCDRSKYYYSAGKHLHYLHCERCHSFYPVPCAGMKTMEKKILDEFRFSVTEHVLLFMGRCEKCRK